MTSYLGGEVKNTLKYKVTKDRGAINRGQSTFFFLIWKPWVVEISWNAICKWVGKTSFRMAAWSRGGVNVEFRIE